MMTSERSDDRRFLRIAVERRYLRPDQAAQVLHVVRSRGVTAEQAAVELQLLSRRRVQRLVNHLRYRTMRRCDRTYAKAAADSGLVPRDVLLESLEEQRRRFSATRQRVRLGTLLIQQGLLDAEQDRSLRQRVIVEVQAAARTAVCAASSAEEALSDVGSELASELGVAESALDTISEAPSETHLAAANAETCLVEATDEAPSGRISIPLDEPDPVVDEVVERSATRYRALDEAVTRVEAIQKIQHDLSNSGVFMAKDSTEIFERACRARACERLTAAEKPAKEANGRSASHTLAELEAILEDAA